MFTAETQRARRTAEGTAGVASGRGRTNSDLDAFDVVQRWNAVPRGSCRSSARLCVLCVSAVSMLGLTWPGVPDRRYRGTCAGASAANRRAASNAARASS